ncbi:MAG: hypothetical protein AVO38_06440 [delta proteobacterium ML8_D]|nr:MAG: hypothetical protein AVO38_06440 [delta proteobacterium ML8_D]
MDPLRYAFDSKIAVHAGAGGHPLSREEVLPTWQALGNRPDASSRRVIYIHVPFCRKQCLYCGFFMRTLGRGDSTCYTDALLREMEQVSCLSAVTGHPIHAVYMGGGTPTALDTVDLERLLEAVRGFFPLADDCEITVEARAADFEEEKVRACVAGGVNRFSVGVQSFNTKVRQQVGRILNRTDVLEMLTNLTDMVDNSVTIIDLIYGLPDQTMTIWEDDLRTLIEETSIDGVDLYQLNVFKDSLLTRAVNKGKLSPPADISCQAEMFLRGRETLEAARFRRLSMSHWGRSPGERNRYNTFIRCGATCFPLGCGAGGRLHGHYFFQEADLKAYYKQVNAGEKPLAMAIRLPACSPLFRNLAEQMEKGDMNLTALGQQHGFDLEAIFFPLLEQWEQTGLIKRQGNGQIELTVAGEFWNVNLTQFLIDYFQHYHQEDAQS